MPTVSVIIPTHDRCEHLRSAIASVLTQTFQDFEITVVDDGSQDHPREVVTAFSDGRIRYVRHETNKGVATARNTGISNSTGDYIAFLDDDDQWLPQKLTTQMDLMQRSPATIGGVYTGYFRVQYPSGKIIDQITPVKRGNVVDELCCNNCIGTASTVLLRRECFARAGWFDESMYYGEEYDMWIRIAKEFDFECISEPLVKYSIHASKLSTNSEIVMTGLETELAKHKHYFARNRRSYSRRFLNLGVLYCHKGNIKKGREAFLRAIELYPFEIRQYWNLCLSVLGARNFSRLKRLKEFFL